MEIKPTYEESMEFTYALAQYLEKYDSLKTVLKNDIKSVVSDIYTICDGVLEQNLIQKMVEDFRYSQTKHPSILPPQ